MIWNDIIIYYYNVFNINKLEESIEVVYEIYER